ncbi:DUF2625 family protein [Ruminococcus albus]|uniref:DUF2625 family protein n=1 Tax=Ruminococcus albus TaxID=1264 RepID=A0A1H7KR47_RUMAL|nr:DUF2625 family protein [Ruminococcus albus]SEK89218.1 Protein of unknown function DUF2625 [Ruminococcus albus]
MNEKARKVLDLINSSEKKVVILPHDDSIGESIKGKYQINPDSVLGILLEHTGGIVIDDWIRVYGSGELDLMARNELFPYDDLVVGEDILGGLFIYLSNGNIGYFAPDSLAVEDMEIGYGNFLSWCLHGDTDRYYTDYRWNGWQDETAGLSLDSGISFYPFLWAKSDSFESRKRSVISMKEIIGLEMEFLKQL